MIARRCRRGLTYLELLATTALVGLAAMTGIGIIGSLAHAADDDGLRTSLAQQRRFALHTFRRAAADSRVAVVERDRVLLDDGGHSDAWCVEHGELRRIPMFDRADCDPGTVALERHARSTLLIVDTRSHGRVVVRVGAAP